jgi:hypothetical protein
MNYPKRQPLNEQFIKPYTIRSYNKRGKYPRPSIKVSKQKETTHGQFGVICKVMDYYESEKDYCLRIQHTPELKELLDDTMRHAYHDKQIFKEISRDGIDQFVKNAHHVFKRPKKQKCLKFIVNETEERSIPPDSIVNITFQLNPYCINGTYGMYATLSRTIPVLHRGKYHLLDIPYIEF